MITVRKVKLERSKIKDFYKYKFNHIIGNLPTKKLIPQLLKNYNKEIRPIQRVDEIIQVQFYMTLQQMISVVEKVRYLASKSNFPVLLNRSGFVRFHFPRKCFYIIIV